MEKRETDEARWERLRKPRHWAVEDASWVMEAWTGSGKSLTQFANDHGMDRERLRRWRSRLGAAQGHRPPSSRPAPTARQTALVPVSVRAIAPLVPVPGDGGAVVVSAGQVQIAIRDLAATSPDWVARLVGRLAAEGAS